MTEKKGYFFSFCGLDGSGKTTQANLLKDYLQSKGYKVSIVSGYKPPINVQNLKDVAQKLGKDYQELFSSGNVTMSLFLDLWIHTKEDIIPKIEQGEIVISERYWESSTIYAPFFGVDEEFMNKIAAQFIIPDLFIYLNIQPEKAYKRVVNRSKAENVPIMKKENLTVMENIYAKYNEFAKEQNAANISIHTDDKFVVFNQIKNAVDGIL
ncbi:dTMP kinase [Listeria monocytogenes]|nr:dTMP kinase [Listeria monocytogenes]MBC1253619.1 dTMP kinase [Listeria welshimeri]